MKRTYRFYLIFIICILCLSGCDRKRVDYVDNSSDTHSGENDIDISTAKLKDKLGVPDSWNEKLSEEYGISIGTSIIVPDVSSMKVIEAKEWYFTDEEKKEIIATITTEPVYDYPVVVEEYTKAQIQEEINYLEDCLKQSSDIIQENEREDIGNSLQVLYAYYETAPDGFSLTTDYSRTAYYTRYNNMDVTIQFLGGDEYSEIIMEPVSNYNRTYDGIEYDTCKFQILDKNTEAENLCKINELEAKEKAIDFVDNFEFGDFEIVDTYPLSCLASSKINATNNIESEKYYDGYTFVFYRHIGGVAVDSREWDLVNGSTHPSNPDADSMIYQNGVVRYQGYGYEKIYVGVNDEGIVCFNYKAPLSLGEITASDVKLLSFDKIQSAIREEIFSQGCYSYKLFNNMELKYLPIKDMDNPGNYSIIPVWILTVEAKYTTRSYVVVNAIDGTIVYMEEQYYDFEIP